MIQCLKQQTDLQHLIEPFQIIQFNLSFHWVIHGNLFPHRLSNTIWNESALRRSVSGVDVVHSRKNLIQLSQVWHWIKPWKVVLWKLTFLYLKESVSKCIESSIVNTNKLYSESCINRCLLTMTLCQ